MKNQIDIPVIERPIVEAQAVFDDLCEQRASLNAHIRLRHESLENIVDWNDLTKKMAKNRVARKSIELDFDEKNSSMKGNIDHHKDQMETIESKLTGLALEYFKKTGTMLEVSKKMRGGNLKKIRIGFGFRQLSLF